MKTEKPLVDKDYVLDKIESWTFVEIPEIPMPKTPFGMLKVKGKIDNYEFSNVHLMPIGNGHIGLAVKSEIRKKIKKQAPDIVHITLYEDNTPLIIPEELLLCMENEEGLLDKFEKYSIAYHNKIKDYWYNFITDIDWINSAKTEQTKANRIAKTITMIQKNEKI